MFIKFITCSNKITEVILKQPWNLILLRIYLNSPERVKILNVRKLFLVEFCVHFEKAYYIFDYDMNLLLMEQLD